MARIHHNLIPDTVAPRQVWRVAPMGLALQVHRLTWEGAPALSAVAVSAVLKLVKRNAIEPADSIVGGVAGLFAKPFLASGLQWLGA